MRGSFSLRLSHRFLSFFFQRLDIPFPYSLKEVVDASPFPLFAFSFPPFSTRPNLSFRPILSASGLFRWLGLSERMTRIMCHRDETTLPHPPTPLEGVFFSPSSPYDLNQKTAAPPCPFPCIGPDNFPLSEAVVWIIFYKVSKVPFGFL